MFFITPYVPLFFHNSYVFFIYLSLRGTPFLYVSKLFLKLVDRINTSFSIPFGMRLLMSFGPLTKQLFISLNYFYLILFFDLFLTHRFYMYLFYFHKDVFEFSSKRVLLLS